MKSIVSRILVILGAISAAISVFLPLGALESKGFGTSYTKSLIDSDNAVAMTILIVSIIVAALWVCRFFFNEKWLLALSKVAGILSSLVLAGLSALAFVYLQNFKNLLGQSPAPYFGFYLLAVGAVLAFVGSVLSKNE